jgi:hypothetical protein
VRAHPLGDGCDHAKVDENEPEGPGPAGNGRQRLDEEVPGMRIGMEQVVHEQLLQIGIEKPAGHLFAVDSSRFKGLEIADLDVGYVLHDQHTPRGHFLVHVGDAYARIVPEIPGKLLGVVTFGDEIQLVACGATELVEQAIEVYAAPHRLVALEPADCRVDGPQVGFDDGIDLGTLDLDDDFLARRQPRPVYLRQGGGRFRLGSEPGEHLIHRPSKFSLDDGLDVFQALGRDLVLQAG